jgi:YfiH family protein
VPATVWTLDDRSDPPAWRAHDSGAAPVLAFSTRRGGVSPAPYDSLNLGLSTEDDPEAVAENRRRFLAALGFAPDRVATAGQVHGASVTVVQEPRLHRGCDALITRTPGIALAITGADCTPLLFTAPSAVGAAHAGWRGTEAGVATDTLSALIALAESSVSDVTVHVGPSIRSCCYRVGEDVARRFPASTVRRSGDALHLDLVAAVRLELGQAGVGESRIHDVGACTACDPARYFSHRRDGPRTGRHWAVAALAGC